MTTLKELILPVAAIFPSFTKLVKSFLKDNIADGNQEKNLKSTAVFYYEFGVHTQRRYLIATFAGKSSSLILLEFVSRESTTCHGILSQTRGDIPQGHKS